MVIARIQAQGLAGFQDDLLTGVDIVAAAVLADENVGIRKRVVGIRVVKLEDDVTAAAVDNVFHLVPVVVVRAVLAVQNHADLLRVALCVLVHMYVAVADGDQREALFVIVAVAEVGNVPAESVVSDLIVLMALALPILRREFQKIGHLKFVLFQHRFKFLDDRIDFRPFHIFCPPFQRFFWNSSLLWAYSSR